MNNFKVFLTVILLLFSCLSYTQLNCETDFYTPKDKVSISKLLAKKKKLRSTKINAPKNAIKYYLRSYYDDFESYLLSKEVIFTEEIDLALQKIVSEIAKSNPTIGVQDFSFFYDTNYIANAASFGDGSFVLNAGLIEILENDDQLAFIICHEIAHELLQHSNKSIGKMLAKNSEQEDISLFYKKSRTAELEADSLGFELFKNTNFSQVEAERALLLLKNSDSLLYNRKTNIESVFSFEKYPFRSSWVEKEERILTIDKKIDDNLTVPVDSLRTHPDIDRRVNKIHKNELLANQTKHSAIVQLKEWQRRYNYCIHRDKKELDIALYKGLVAHQIDQTDETAILQIGQALQDIYEAKKNHKLGLFTTRPGPFELTGEMNTIKRFVSNTDLGEIKWVGYYFCKQFEHIDNQEFQNINQFFKQKITNK